MLPTALGVIAVASFLPLWVSGYILGLLTIAYYFGVFAMAWDLLFGFAGEVSFGATNRLGPGGYTAGILDNLYQPPIWAASSPARSPPSPAAWCWRCRRCACAISDDDAGCRADAAKFRRGRG